MNLEWIKSFIFVICYVLLKSYDVQAAINGKIKSDFIKVLKVNKFLPEKPALIIYTSDASNDNLVSIQLDSVNIDKIISDSEKKGGIVKRINIRDLKNINELFNGKSTKFSFSDESENSQCDINCNAVCKKITTLKPITTTSKPPPKPFISKKDTVTGPPYLPPISVTNKDEVITIPTRTSQTTTTQRSIVTTTTTPRSTSIVSTKNDIQTTKQTTKLATTTTTRRPITTSTVAITRSKSTPGPPYLPISIRSTTRGSTVSRGITYPPATWPSTSRVYTSFFPTWIPPVRRDTFETKPTTTTVRYQYKEPSNFLIYARNSDGELEIE